MMLATRAACHYRTWLIQDVSSAEAAGRFVPAVLRASQSGSGSLHRFSRAQQSCPQRPRATSICTGVRTTGTLLMKDMQDPDNKQVMHSTTRSSACPGSPLPVTAPLLRDSARSAPSSDPGTSLTACGSHDLSYIDRRPSFLVLLRAVALIGVPADSSRLYLQPLCPCHDPPREVLPRSNWQSVAG